MKRLNVVLLLATIALNSLYAAESENAIEEKRKNLQLETDAAYEELIEDISIEKLLFSLKYEQHSTFWRSYNEKKINKILEEEKKEAHNFDYCFFRIQEVVQKIEDETSHIVNFFNEHPVYGKPRKDRLYHRRRFLVSQNFILNIYKNLIFEAYRKRGINPDYLGLTHRFAD